MILKTLLIATAMISVQPAEEKALVGDLGKVQGEWVTQLVPLKQFPITLVFTNDKVSIKGTFSGEAFEYKGEFKTSEKSDTKTMDFVKMREPGGDEVKDIEALYKLEGDKLTLCSGHPGDDRPTAFKTGENGRPVVLVFARKKAEEKPEDEAKAELAKFKGTWKGRIGETKEVPVILTFADTKVDVKFTPVNGDEVKISGEIMINAKATPKTIDFLKFKNGEGEDVRDNLGIYRIEGDTLTVATGGPGNPRPTEFKAESGEGGGLFKFEREKK